MSKIRVGWDYDEPCFKWYDLAHEASLRAGIALPEHEPTSWAPHETYGCTLDEWVAVLDEEVLQENGGFYGAPLDPLVKLQMERVVEAGGENYIVTARGSLGIHGSRIKNLTRDQIRREKLPVAEVVFSPDKGRVVHTLRLDYFIDDRPKHWEEIALFSPRTDVYLLDERWNRDFEVPSSKRVHSIREYVDIVLQDTRILASA